MEKVNYTKIFEDMVKGHITNLSITEYNSINNILQNNKKRFNTFEIIYISKSISKSKNNKNNRLRSYQKEDIEIIIKYKNENGLSIRKASKLFDISPSTLSRWEKFLKN